jgi:aryl-alcohol dehydrogenase-like predicted oxidoreductase
MKTARELGVAIVAYSPIGRGMLGGNIRHNSDLADDDTRKSSPRCKCFQREPVVIYVSPRLTNVCRRARRGLKDAEYWHDRTEISLVSEENFPKNLQLVDTIIEIAKKKKVTSSQLTLAWLLAQGDDIFPVRTPLPLSFSCAALNFGSRSCCCWSNKFDS